MADAKQERETEQQRGETQPAKGTRLSAVEIHDNILEPAEEEMRRPAASLLWSALSSGLVIGFSFLAGGYVRELTPDRYDQAASSAVYPLGFIFVIIARSMLFTENTIVPIMPLLNRRNLETFWRVLRLWGLLLVGNLIGAFAFAWVLARTPVVSAHLHGPLLALADESTVGGFWLVCYQALFAGWLIALLTWLLASTHATGAQIVLTWLATAPIAAFGFRHSIAGAVEAFYRVAAGSASLGQALGGFIAPAVLGNALGGVLLVALVNYGQVAPERPPRPG
jgi:formate/nitrite transporter FocA (FNT family)